MAPSLIGRTLIDANGRTLMVTGYAAWSSQYVELEGDGFRTARNVTQLVTYFAGRQSVQRAGSGRGLDSPPRPPARRSVA